MFKDDASTTRAELLTEDDSLSTSASGLRASINQLAQLAALSVRAPMALVALERPDGTWLTFDTGVAGSWLATRAHSFLEVLSRQTMSSPESVTVREVDPDEENDGEDSLHALGAAAWAAVPLTRSDKSPIGVLCVFDTAPRDWMDEEIQGLNHAAELTVAMTELSEVENHDINSPAENRGNGSHSQTGNGRELAMPGRREEGPLGSNEEATVRASHGEQRFRSLFDFNLDAIFSFDIQGNFNDANPACEALTGYSVDELRRMSFTPLIVPEDQEKAWEDFRSALSGAPQYWDLAIHRRDGQRRELHGTSVPMVIDDEVVGVFGVAQDVTERKQTENALREREAELRFQRSLLIAQGEASTDGFMVVSGEGEILSYNHRFMELWGIPEEVMKSGSILEARQAILDNLPDPDRYLRYIHYLYDRPDEECHDEIQLKDGRIFERYSAPVRSSDGGNFGRVWYYRDMTDKKQAEKQLLEQTGRLDSLVRYNPDLVVTLDFQGSFLTVNPAVTKVLGYQAEALIGQPFTAIVDRKDHVPAWERIAQLARGESPSLELTVRHQEGHAVELSVQGIPIILDQKIIGFWAIGKDITEAKQTADKLQQSESTLADAQRIAGIGSWEWDLRTNLLNWSAETYRVLGFSRNQEKPTFEMFMEAVHPDDRPAVQAALAATLQNGVAYDIDIVITLPTGEDRSINAQGEVTFNEHGEPERMAGTVLDITERKSLEKQLAYRADHDSLTGLANRHQISTRIGQSLNNASSKPGSIGLLFIDLDDFKAVNDSLGHDAGDELLTIVAARLLDSAREEDTVARLGGDEFIVLLEHVTAKEELEQVAERIISSLQQPFSVQGVTLSVTSSIGIVPDIPPHEDPATVLQDADLAMYRAKQRGKSRYEVFTPSMRGSSRDRIQLRNELRKAVEEETFTLDYQPLIHLDTGVAAGAEALLRWDSPTTGEVPPGEFIPIAERCGLINPIGQWVIHQAGRQVQDWNDRMSHRRPLVMCANISAMQLGQRDFAETVESTLHENGLDPRSLCFEITESFMVARDGHERDNLFALSDLGIRLAVDDFGTGHSSLSYLKDLPIDWLKVDRVFINQLTHENERNAILTAIVQLAHALEIQVVAEGVETVEQLEIVRELGCDMAQGFYIAKPASGEETFRYLIDHSM